MPCYPKYSKYLVCVSTMQTLSFITMYIPAHQEINIGTTPTTLKFNSTVFQPT